MKSNFLLVLALVFFTLGISTAMSAQSENKILTSPQTFVVKETGNTADLNKYIKAIEEGDWTTYRRYDSRRELIFDSGLKVQLLSYVELQAMGIETSIELLDKSGPVTRKPSIFFLHPAGIIMERID